MLSPVNQVSSMTTSQVLSEPQGVPTISPPDSAVFDLGRSERLVTSKTIAGLADPMQSETVKGWLSSDLLAPN
jgi:hypothetical protein